MDHSHLKVRAGSHRHLLPPRRQHHHLREDTGRGIQPQLLDHIFEKGVSSKGENRGTGLFLVHELMEEYGGTIDIDTEPGEGTCFTLTFTRKETESNV